jgi:chorismate lyase / 3-hydroxybenzoate synthase
VLHAHGPFAAMGLRFLASYAVPTFGADDRAAHAVAPVRLCAGDAIRPLVVFLPSYMTLVTAAPRRLAEAFAGQADVVMLDYPGLHGGAVPDSVETLALLDAVSVREIAQDRPVVLTGFCVGGSVAHAVAQQLSRTGTPPAGVVLIDSHHSPDSRHDPRNLSLVRWGTDLPRQQFARLFDDSVIVAGAAYGRLFRIWQYIEDINGPNVDGLENYRDYCAGRAAAFEHHGGTASMPAATGVGARSGGVSVHLLAARTGARQVENPRQLPAYRYPRQYGPKPPSFARATWCDGALYLAGTASIVGHRTVHPNDAVVQCRTALANIETLLNRDNLARYGIHTTMGLTDLDRIKVYVRRVADVPAVREICRSAFGARPAMSFIVIDLCRAELLVEIEGIVAVAGANRGRRPPLGAVHDDGWTRRRQQWRHPLVTPP